MRLPKTGKKVENGIYYTGTVMAFTNAWNSTLGYMKDLGYSLAGEVKSMGCYMYEGIEYCTREETLESLLMFDTNSSFLIYDFMIAGTAFAIYNKHRKIEKEESK